MHFYTLFQIFERWPKIYIVIFSILEMAYSKFLSINDSLSLFVNFLAHVHKKDLHHHNQFPQDMFCIIIMRPCDLMKHNVAHMNAWWMNEWATKLTTSPVSPLPPWRSHSLINGLKTMSLNEWGHIPAILQDDHNTRNTFNIISPPPPVTQQPSTTTQLEVRAHFLDFPSSITFLTNRGTKRSHPRQQRRRTLECVCGSYTAGYCQCRFSSRDIKVNGHHQFVTFKINLLQS